MFYRVLPYFIFKRLFGDRRKLGTIRQDDDVDFAAWLKCYHKVYEHTQKGKLGTKVNHYGFKIVKDIDYDQKVVLEIGPGKIEHIQYNKLAAKEFILVDIDKGFLTASKNILNDNGIQNIKTKVSDFDTIPQDDNSVDIVLTFHQLEHVYNLENYLLEIKRIIKPGGLLVGAVPTEGSLAWGIGRYFTSRRYLINELKLNWNKIVCWEHPNFVDKIQYLLRKHFTLVKHRRNPFHFMPNDFNLSYSFILINDK